MNSTEGKSIGRGRTQAVVALLLITHVALLAWSATKHSPNLNETAHLVAGVSHWNYRRFELYRVNPPLVRMIATLPLLASDVKYDWSEFNESPGARPVFQLGSLFVKANGEKTIWFLTLARWSCIPFSLLGGLICFFWAKDLYGSKAGLLTLSLWCFSPNILAHGQFITPDCGATALGITAAFFYWKWLCQPNWRNAFLSGALLGITELTKTTWIVLFALWPAMWIASSLFRNAEIILPWKRQACQLTFLLLVGLYILNLGYAFEGSFTKLGEFHFVSQALRGQNENESDQQIHELQNNLFSNSWLGTLPVPLPKQYVLGIDIQKKDFEDFGRESYLNGEFSEEGWWYYYLYALMVKVPVGYWIIFVLAALYAIRKRPLISTDWLNGFVLAVPALTVLVLVSSQTGFNHHMRYVLPCLPFAFVWMGQAALWFSERNILATLVTCGALVWAILSSMLVYPHSLSYFNEFAGGPVNGHKHLLNSNIDWGQDLLFLREWIKRHPEAKPLHLCYYGFFSPQDLSLNYPLPPLDENQAPDFCPPPGWYAISVNYMKGYGWQFPKNGFAYFQKYEPVDMAGYSIYIYHIAEEKTETN